MKKTLLVSLALSLLGAFGGYFISQETSINQALNIPNENTFILILTIQAGVLTFIFSFLGLLIQKRTPFHMMNKGNKVRGAFLAILLGLLTGFIIQISDAWVFPNLISQLESYTPATSLNGLLGGVFYGGIVEEVMLRLFGMTLIIYLLQKVLKENKLPSPYYWVAIVITSFLFALAHLPANAAIFRELNTLIITRALILNGIGGLFFGYLYWKYGFWFSVLSHMTAHIGMQLIFIPLLF